MYPNLYFLIEGLFGIQPYTFFAVVQTFGLFMAVSFILAGVVLVKDINRRTGLGQFQPVLRERVITENPSISDLLVNALIGFLIGFKLLYIIQNSSEFVSNAPGTLLSTKGSIIGGVLGALALMGSKYWEKRQEAKKHNVSNSKTIKEKIQPSDYVGDILIVAAISGLIGAKLFAVAEYPEALIKDPVGQLLSGNGLAIYGGLVGGFIGVYLFIRKLGFPLLHMMDTAAPAMLLGQGVGRIGCHLSGDGDWGIVNTAAKPFAALPDWLWSLTYPHNVNSVGNLIEGCKGKFYTDDYCYELPEGVYPTSVYELIMLVGLFAIFWMLRERFTSPGVLFSWYLIASSIERFFIEFIRVNPKYMLNLSQAQIIALVLLVLGVLGVFYFKYKHQQKTAKS
jgi:phosphatidylglycerol---prolipoprotein diacylglyceryl transferase